MKKILIALVLVFVAVFFKLSDIHKSLTFGSVKEVINVVPVDHKLVSTDEFVVVTDEISLFNKFLVEVPIDLEVTEKSTSKLVLKNSEGEKRQIMFDLVDEGEAYTRDYNKLKSLLETTYTESSHQKSLFKPFEHSKILLIKQPLMISKSILSFDEERSKGFIFDAEEDKCDLANVFINDVMIDISFCGTSSKERDYVINTLTQDK